MQQVPTRLGTAVPDRIVEVPYPSCRWVLEHKTAYGPGIVSLTINPTIGMEGEIRKNLRDLMIGIEAIDHEHSALLFMFAVAGSVAYTDKVHPSQIQFCHIVETEGGFRHEVYKPDALVGSEVTVSHYQNEDTFAPFDFRWLRSSRQTEDKLILEFDKDTRPMRLVMRSAAKY